MKVLVCGGRDYNDRAKVFNTLDRLFKSGGPDYCEMLIHGGARGADSLGGEWARSHGIPEVIVPANWDYYGKRAGLERNHWLLQLEPDAVVAFPGGTGTRHMVSLCRAVIGMEIHEIGA